MPHPLFSTLRTAACLFCLVGPQLLLAQEEPAAPNLIAPPGAAELESSDLDLHTPGSPVETSRALLPMSEAPTGPVIQAEPVLTGSTPTTAPPPQAAPARPVLEADSLTPPELEQDASSPPPPSAPAPTSAQAAPPAPTVRASAPLEYPPSGENSAVRDATTSSIDSMGKALEAEESSAQRETNSLLLYLGVFVGIMVLLLLILVLVLSQQQRRGRRRKRRRKDDLPLKQRMAVSQQHLMKEAANSGGAIPPTPREHPMAPPNRVGGGPRRITSRNGSPATAPTAVDSGRIGTDAREEYSTLFEHMLRLNRLREGEPDAPLDRMTLAELHLHYNALLRIVPTEAREPLVESIEIILDELEGQGEVRGD